MKKLDTMNIGEVGIIDKIDSNLNIKHRLLEMGFVSGEKIECLLINPFKNMKAYKIKETVIGLRNTDASRIYIKDDIYDRV